MLNQGSISVVNSTNVLNLSGSNISGIDTITSLGTLTIIGNTVVTGTLGVTGVSTLAAVNTRNLAVNGTILSGHTILETFGAGDANPTGANVATGYIRCGGAGGVFNVTLPTPEAIHTAIGGSGRGTIFDLFIDNTNGTGGGGVGTVLIAAVGFTASTSIALIPTVPVNQVARFTLMFTTATACIVSRTA